MAQFAGTMMYSIAWTNGQLERVIANDLERNGITELTGCCDSGKCEKAAELEPVVAEVSSEADFEEPADVPAAESVMEEAATEQVAEESAVEEAVGEATEAAEPEPPAEEQPAAAE